MVNALILKQNEIQDEVSFVIHIEWLSNNLPNRKDNFGLPGIFLPIFLCFRCYFLSHILMIFFICYSKYYVNIYGSLRKS